MTAMGRDRLDFLTTLDGFVVRLEKRDPAAATELRDLVLEEASHEGAISQRRAAKILNVSEETVASWLETEVLTSARTSTSDLPRVEPRSLLRAKEKLDDLRAQGLSRRLVLRIMRGPSSAPRRAPRVAKPLDHAWLDRVIEEKRRAG